MLKDLGRAGDLRICPATRIPEATSDLIVIEGLNTKPSYFSWFMRNNSTKYKNQSEGPKPRADLAIKCFLLFPRFFTKNLF